MAELLAGGTSASRRTEVQSLNGASTPCRWFLRSFGVDRSFSRSARWDPCGGRPESVIMTTKGRSYRDHPGNTVTELSPTGATLGNFAVTNGVSGEIAFDGTHMWVVNSSDNTVTEL